MKPPPGRFFVCPARTATAASAELRPSRPAGRNACPDEKADHDRALPRQGIPPRQNEKRGQANHPSPRIQWGLLLPGAPEPRPDGLMRPGLYPVGTGAALRSDSHRSIVVVGNYCIWPVTAVPYRAKGCSFASPSKLFRPHQMHRPKKPRGACGGGAGYCPRVRGGLLEQPFIAIA